MNGFRTPQVSQLTGVNPKTLHYWDASKFISPSLAQSHGTGTRRIYSFEDLVALRVARQLREAGASLQALRKVIDFLHDHKGIRYPMSETFLLTDGKEVEAQTGAGLVSVLRQPGQGLLFHVVNLSGTVKELHEAVVRLGTPAPGKSAKMSSKAS